MNEQGGPEDSTLEDAGTALGEAVQAAFKALVLVIIVTLTVLARALQAVFVLARPAVLFASSGAAVAGAVVLFQTVLARYGGDAFSAMLALAFVAVVPASLLMLAHDSAGLWPVLWASAGLMLLAHFGISRAPPVVLALLPVVALAGCILYFAFGQNFHIKELEEARENEQQE